MADLPPTERPRERMQRLGAAALTVPELFAILLGAAGDRDPAVGIGYQLVASCAGSLRQLSGESESALSAVPGVGPARAARLVAAFELMRRWTSEAPRPRLSVASPPEIVAAFAPRLEDLTVEEFHVGILDVQHCLERDIRISTGVLDCAAVHAREVFRRVMGTPAAAVVLMHNHPSGDPTPSPEDHRITAQLAAAGRIIGIPLCDHVIIGRGRYTSFLEEQWL